MGVLRFCCQLISIVIKCYYFNKISPKTPCCSANGKCGSSNDDCECWDCVNYLHSEYLFIYDIQGKIVFLINTWSSQRVCLLYCQAFRVHHFFADPQCQNADADPDIGSDYRRWVVPFSILCQIQFKNIVEMQGEQRLDLRQGICPKFYTAGFSG